MLLTSQRMAKATHRKCLMRQQAEAARLDAAQASAARRLAIQLGLWQPLRLVLRDCLLPTPTGVRVQASVHSAGSGATSEAATAAAAGAAAAAWRLMPLHPHRTFPSLSRRLVNLP